MSTQLVPAGSAAITNVAALPPASVQVMATDPAAMADAQHGLVDWFRQRLQLARRDQRDAEDNLTTARASGFKSDSFARAATRARQTSEYYEKCLAAVEAGYMIIPDLPVDIFAIRTTRSLPRDKHSRAFWKGGTSDFPQCSNKPPLGEGEYVDRFPVKDERQETYTEKDEQKTRWLARPAGFADVEFPVALATPAVMTATRAAMARNLFDEIGGLPGRRSINSTDPIVVGRVLRPGPPRLQAPGVSFLIAWWVDTRQL